MTKVGREANERTDVLARRIYDVLEEGEVNTRQLDGQSFKKARWERAHAALFELLRRLEKATA